MTLLRFDESRLREQLEPLDHRQRLAFGACCCSRLMPNYVAFSQEQKWGQPNVLENALGRAWDAIRGTSIANEEISQLISTLSCVTPDTEQFDTILASSALDACNALIELLSAVKSADLDLFIRIAGYAVDTVDMYVQDIESMNPGAPDLELRIRTHRFMQRELKQQQEDLERIRSLTPFNATSVDSVRHSSNYGGKSNLDLPA